MQQRTVQRLGIRVHGVLVCAVLSLVFQGSMVLLPAQDSRTRVELACKLVQPPEERGRQVWRVEFRKASGELLREEFRNGGDRFHIGNLKPGIYIMCLSGNTGRQRCESMDLTPAAGTHSTKFNLRFEVPRRTAGQADDFLISTRRLSVPRQAQQEMANSEEAQRRGDFHEATRCLERALQIYPDYPDALNNLGVQFRRLRDFKKAIGLFGRVTKIDPDFYPGWINLGGALLSAGQFSEALDANLRAQKLRSNDAVANSQLAMNYYYLRDYDEATKYFKRVHELDPLNASSPQLFLAQIAISQQRSSDAQEYIRNYLELHPNSPQAPQLKQTLGRLTAVGHLSQGEMNLTSRP